MYKTIIFWISPIFPKDGIYQIQFWKKKQMEIYELTMNEKHDNININTCIYEWKTWQYRYKYIYPIIHITTVYYKKLIF